LSLGLFGKMLSCKSEPGKKRTVIFDKYFYYVTFDILSKTFTCLKMLTYDVLIEFIVGASEESRIIVTETQRLVKFVIQCWKMSVVLQSVPFLLKISCVKNMISDL